MHSHLVWCSVWKKDDTVSEEDEEEEEETIQIFTVSDVDFGIVERPRYKVQVDNVINKITLKTSEGSVLKRNSSKCRYECSKC